MSSPQTCQNCGDILPADTRHCPRCLLSFLAGNGPPDGDPSPERGSTENARGGRRTIRYFGDYELVGQIASGGMGVVHLARQISLNRIVALKMVLAGKLATAAEVRRFRTEAEAAANLDHPNIVPIYEVGEYEGQHYFSMKLIEGGHLGELNAACRARDHGWLRRAAGLMVTVGHAVHHAHQRGILHRDIKPTNILLDEKGEPHLTDFGLAKRTQTGDELTQTLTILGTPHYMAPEQATGAARGLTTAADIYSLGAVLFELATGRPPFEGDSALELLRKAQENEPPSLRQLNPSVDKDLETICRKCLEKEPHARYASAEALAQDLERWLRGEPIRAHPTTPIERVKKWTRRNPALASLIVLAHVLFLAGIVGVLSQWRRAEIEAAYAEMTAKESRQRLIDLNVDTGARVLEEGDHFRAMLWFAEALRLEAPEVPDEMHQFRLSSVLSQSPKLLHAWFVGGQSTHATFSPDGSLILIFSGREASLWDAASLQELRFNGGSDETVLGFANDSRHLLLRGTNGICFLNPVHNQRTREIQHRGVRGARFSPDGRRLATYAVDGSVRLWDGETGAPAGPTLNHTAAVRILEFSGDGRRLAAGDDAGLVTLWDLESGKPVFPPVRGSKGIWVLRLNTAGNRLATIVEDDFGAELRDAATGTPVAPRLDHAYWASDVRFSRDGSRVLTCGWDRAAKIWDSESGRLLAPLLGHSKVVLSGQFSQDGQRVLTRSHDGSARVWNVKDGSKSAPPFWHASSLNSAVFNPAGERVLTATMNGMVRLWSLEAGPKPFVPWSYSQPRTLHSSTRTGRLITQNNAGLIEYWSPSARKAVSARAPNWVIDAWVSADEKRMLAAGYKGGKDRTTVVFHTWELPSGAPLSEATVRVAPGVVVYAHKTCTAAAVCSSNVVEVFDTATGERRISVAHPARSAFAVFDATMRRMAVRTKQTVYVWDISTGQAVCPPLEHHQDVFTVVISPDGRSLLTSCSDSSFGRRKASIWDIDTGRLKVPPLEHNDGVWFAAFSPDGSRVVTCSEDETARLWDARTGEPLCPPMEHQRTVRHASFSPDGTKLATGSIDRTVRLWDVATGKPLSPPLHHAERVERVFFADDGQSLVAFTGDLNQANVVCWPLPKEVRPVAEWVAVAQLLSGHAIDPTGGLAPLGAEALSNLWVQLATRYPVDVPPASRPRRQVPPPAGPAHSPVAPSPGAFSIPERDPSTPPALVDLTSFYNAALNQTWHGTETNNDLSLLPTGIQTFAGVQFDVRGLIQLACRKPLSTNFPAGVHQIPIAMPCRRLHFLHAATMSWGATNGEPVARIEMHFADGGSSERLVRFGSDVRDWWVHPRQQPTGPDPAVCRLVRHQARRPATAAFRYHLGESAG